MAGWDYPLTQEEMNALNYSRQNMNPERGLANQDGSLTTFKGAISGVDDKQMYYPTYWDKQVLLPNEALQRALRSGIKFPMYGSVEEAEARERVVHDYMERDTQEYNKRKKRGQ